MLRPLRRAPYLERHVRGGGGGGGGREAKGRAWEWGARGRRRAREEREGGGEQGGSGRRRARREREGGGEQGGTRGMFLRNGSCAGACVCTRRLHDAQCGLGRGWTLARITACFMIKSRSRSGSAGILRSSLTISRIRVSPLLRNWLGRMGWGEDRGGSSGMGSGDRWRCMKG